MIQLNCKVLAYILSSMRRALGILKRSEHLVVLTSGDSATSVRVSTADVSITCSVPCGGSKRSNQLELAVPMRLLATLPEGARQYVTFDAIGGHATRSTLGGQVSITEKWELYPVPPATAVGSAGNWRISNSTRLGQALHHAASVSDPDSLRYSLGCIRLRGSDGQVAVTDGRQVFAASGFAFPFDEVLVPGAAMGRLKCLTDCSSISIGLASDWLSLSTSNGMYRWLINLRIQKNGRFPNVDMCIPRKDSSRTVVTISDADAEFLLKNLPRLIGKCDELLPMTLDLAVDRLLGKRQVRLRFRRIDTSRVDHGSAPVTEVTLDESTYNSPAMMVAMDHHFLLNALRFGHRQIHLRSPSEPVFCYGTSGNFVWAPMHESLTIGPTSTMQCLSTRQAIAAA